MRINSVSETIEGRRRRVIAIEFALAVGCRLLGEIWLIDNSCAHSNYKSIYSMTNFNIVLEKSISYIGIPTID